MTRGSRPILTEALLSEVESDEDGLDALEMPTTTRLVIATEFARLHGGLWKVDESQRNAVYELRTGERPGREVREQRATAKRSA